MNALSEFLKKWWLPLASYLLATTPSALVLLFQHSSVPYIKEQDPLTLLNIAALLLWIVLLLVVFIFSQHSLLRWDEPTGTWISRISALRYCAKCRAIKIVTPLKNEVTGWRCMHCQNFFSDPKRAQMGPPKKRAAQSERI